MNFFNNNGRVTQH